jgi:hypothetical protein
MLESQEPPPPVPAPAPPVAASQEPTSSVAKPTWSDQLEKVGKHVVLGSVVVYSMGYAVAASHYTSAGVPAAELSHNSFVGAGLLFLGITALGVLASQAAVAAWRRLERTNYVARVASALVFWLLLAFPIVSLVQPGGLPRIPSWEFVFLMLVGGMAQFLRFAIPRPGPNPHLRWSITISFSVVSVLLFSAVIYPYVPQAFGGGSPSMLFIWNAGDHAPPFPKPIVDFACPPETAIPPPCRIVSLVYTGPSHLYFSVEERRMKCAPPPHLRFAAWPHWYGDKSASRFCFVRLADSEVKQLPIPSL